MDGILNIGRNGLPLKRKKRLEIIQKIISGQKEFSTTRTMCQYRNMLFPDKNICDNDTFIQFLDKFNPHGNTIIVDIGSGFPTPYNVANTILRKNYCHTIKYMGIDPRFKNNQVENEHFSKRTIAWGYLNIFWQHLVQWFSKRRIYRDLAKENYHGCYAKQIPLPDNSAHLVLSNFCLPYWIWSEKELIETFHEIIRIIDKKGEIRLFPILFSDKQYFIPGTFIGSLLDRHFELEYHNNTTIYKNDPLRPVGDTLILRPKE